MLDREIATDEKAVGCTSPSAPMTTSPSFTFRYAEIGLYWSVRYRPSSGKEREIATDEKDSAVGRTSPSAPMTASASMFTFRKCEIGLHWSVWHKPSSGIEEEIFGFVTEQDAKDWITNKSSRWLR